MAVKTKRQERIVLVSTFAFGFPALSKKRSAARRIAAERRINIARGVDLEYQSSMLKVSQKVVTPVKTGVQSSLTC
jgi:hypothetical protein